MPLENRNLEPGTVLTARYKKQDRSCEVVETADATPGSAQSGLRYRLDDGTEHKSPSSAGKAVTGIACNGWVFWSLAGTEKPKRTVRSTASHELKKAETPAKAPKAEKAAKTKKAPAAKKPGKAKSGKKPKAQRAAAASDASYGCGACGESFPTQKAAIDHAMTHTV